jgi:hypothetical protein
MWLAMPTCVFTSPAVVMVRMPVSQVSGSSVCGTGSQRYWPSEMTSSIDVRRGFPVGQIDLLCSGR